MHLLGERGPVGERVERLAAHGDVVVDGEQLIDGSETRLGEQRLLDPGRINRGAAHVEHVGDAAEQRAQARRRPAASQGSSVSEVRSPVR